MFCAGIGSCFAAAIYEVGRPKRLSSDEAVELENQWQDFGEHSDALFSPPGALVKASRALICLSDILLSHLACTSLHGFGMKQAKHIRLPHLLKGSTDLCISHAGSR